MTSMAFSKVKGERFNLERLIQELARQQANLEVIMACMSQGVALFGADHKLIICNRRYMEIYGLPEELGVTGLPFREMLRYRIDCGSYPEVKPDDYVAQSLEVVAAQIPCKFVHTLKNGRSVSFNYIPLEGGGWISTHEDVTEIYVLQREVQHMAFHDQLTGLPNRRMLIERLAEANRLCSAMSGFALLFLDLDGFKPVNDRYGHSVGDRLLSLVAGRLTDCVRKEDTVARLGGDEFAIVQQSADGVGDAVSLARRILEVMEDPFDIGAHKVNVSASIGIIFTNEKVDESDQLLIRADQAMYQAKRSGRRRFCLYEGNNLAARKLPAA